jgi:hypothetical protein
MKNKNQIITGSVVAAVIVLGGIIGIVILLIFTNKKETSTTTQPTTIPPTTKPPTTRPTTTRPPTTIPPTTRPPTTIPPTTRPPTFTWNTVSLDVTKPYVEQGQNCIEAGGIYTGGVNKNFPGCSGFCCKANDMVAYLLTRGTTWTPVSLPDYPEGRYDLQARDCTWEGGIYTGGNNVFFGCDSAYCCIDKPITYITWTGVTLTTDNESYDIQARNCVDNGGIFTGGENFRFSGCGTFYCCKPSDNKWFEIRGPNWTGVTLPIFEDYSSSSKRCIRMGGVYTGGKNDKFPGCGTFFCCQPQL